MSTSDSEVEVSKKRTCSRCGLPCKGHPGPYGSNCTAVLDFNNSTMQASGSQEISALTQQLSQVTQMFGTMIKKQDDLVSNFSPGLSHHGPSHGLSHGPHDLHGQHKDTLPSWAAPDIDETLRKEARKGNYLDFAVLLAGIDGGLMDEDTVVAEKDGLLTVQKKKSVVTVNSFNHWLAAWNQYEFAIIQAFPELYPRFWRYREFIQKTNNKYMWPAVYRYDVQFRRRLAVGDDHFAYDRVDSDLFVTILDATAVKQPSSHTNGCFRCKSQFHSVKQCPFREEKKVGEEHAFAHNMQPPEICRNWQFRNCYFKDCRRRHVCIGCFGPEPHSSCPSYGQAAGSPYRPTGNTPYSERGGNRA